MRTLFFLCMILYCAGCTNHGRPEPTSVHDLTFDGQWPVIIKTWANAVIVVRDSSSITKWELDEKTGELREKTVKGIIPDDYTGDIGGLICQSYTDENGMLIALALPGVYQVTATVYDITMPATATDSAKWYIHVPYIYSPEGWK